MLEALELPLQFVSLATDTQNGHHRLGKRLECASEKLEKEKSKPCRTLGAPELTVFAVAEDPIWKSLTFHHLGLIISAAFGALAVAISFFLILRHATHYLKPYEQKQCVCRYPMDPKHKLTILASYEFSS